MSTTIAEEERTTLMTAPIRHMKVRKRNGTTIQPWNSTKLFGAILKAFREIKKEITETELNNLIDKITTESFDRSKNNNYMIDVETIQTIVKQVLMNGHPEAAEAYIIYAHKRTELRKKRAVSDIPIISDYIHATRYAKYREDLGRRELFKETVARNRDMHKQKYPALSAVIDEIFARVEAKQVLPSMRSMQYGGEAILKNNCKMYNCSFSVCNRPRFFAEALHLLLSGTGVGYSVQWHHVSQLPELTIINKSTVKHVIIEDSIEGWADAVNELINSYMSTGEYIEFNYYKIRNKGSLIKTSGGMAPGHLPLKHALELVRNVLDGAQGRRLEPIECYDIVCMLCESVHDGGVREAATICLFSIDDPCMMHSKTRDWYKNYPWRARSNNSVVLMRSEVTKDQFLRIFKATKQWGEPGFVFMDDKDYGVNPCLTGDMRLLTTNGYKTIKELWENGGRHEFGDSDYGVLDIINHNGRASATNVYRTSIGSPIYKVSFSDGSTICATSNHKFWVLGMGMNNITINGEEYVQKELCNLICNDSNQINDLIPTLDGLKVMVLSKEYVGIQETFCLTEPKDHSICINGKIISQCSEIGLNPRLTIDPVLKHDIERWAAETKRKIPKLHNGDVYWGWEFCNLTEVNCAAAKSEQEFYDLVKAATILGTLQAGFNSFPYLDWVTEAICRRESLLGVSLTAIMDNPDIALNAEILRNAAQVAVDVNIEYAAKIGINSAARICCVKPSGSASLIVGNVGSGIHPHHARRYFRRIRTNPADKAYQYFKERNPHMCKRINDTKELIIFPVVASDKAITRKDMTALQFLEKVLLVQKNWIASGNAKPHMSRGASHNVSNTVSVKDDEWDQVANFIWEHRKALNGVSLLSDVGDKMYEDAPREEVVNEKDEAIWQHLVSNYKSVDWSLFKESSDNTNRRGELACAGGSCELK